MDESSTAFFVSGGKPVYFVHGMCIIFERKKKTYSNLLFESSQASLLVIFVFGMHLLFIIALNDLWVKYISIILCLFGILKAFIDLRRKKQDHTNKFINKIEKYANIIFVFVIIIHWLLGFFFGENNSIEASIIGGLFPLLIVLLEIFIVEYSVKQIITLFNFMKYPEKYREALDISVKDWYGKKSKEYKKLVQTINNRK